MRTNGRTGYSGWLIAGALLLGLASSGAGTALARQPAAPPGPPPQKERLLTPEDHAAMAQIFWHRVQERLSLTDQERTDIQALLQTQRMAAQADIQNLIAARRQLRGLLEQQTTDPAAIQAVATQVKALQAKLFDDRLQTQLTLRTKFTLEQWQGWLSLRRGMGRRWMQRGRASGPGAL
ncbi:MAG: periplasmic heavy metal sensor [Candidatus Methylomirabilota bacterium]